MFQYVGEYVRKVGTKRWEELFHRSKMLSDEFLAFGLGEASIVKGFLNLLSQDVDSNTEVGKEWLFQRPELSPR